MLLVEFRPEQGNQRVPPPNAAARRKGQMGKQGNPFGLEDERIARGRSHAAQAYRPQGPKLEPWRRITSRTNSKRASKAAV